MCSPGWGNLVAIDWNDLPVGRNLTAKFLKNVKSPPHTLPPPRPRRLNIDRCIVDKFPSSVHTTHLDLTCVHVAWRLRMTIVCVVVVYYYYYYYYYFLFIYFFFLPELLFPESWAFSPENPLTTGPAARRPSGLVARRPRGPVAQSLFSTVFFLSSGKSTRMHRSASGLVVQNGRRWIWIRLPFQ